MRFAAPVVAWSTQTRNSKLRLATRHSGDAAGSTGV